MISRLRNAFRAGTFEEGEMGETLFVLIAATWIGVLWLVFLLQAPLDETSGSQLRPAVRPVPVESWTRRARRPRPRP
jgi:hypothetical protein